MRDAFCARKVLPIRNIHCLVVWCGTYTIGNSCFKGRTHYVYDPPFTATSNKRQKLSPSQPDLMSSQGVFLPTNIRAADPAAQAQATTPAPVATSSNGSGGSGSDPRHGAIRDVKDSKSGHAATNNLDELAKRMTGMCVECEDQPADVSCETCDEDFCEVCYVAQHKHGARSNHKHRKIAPPLSINAGGADSKSGGAKSAELLAAEKAAASESAAVANKFSKISNAKVLCLCCCGGLLWSVVGAVAVW